MRLTWTAVSLAIREDEEPTCHGSSSVLCHLHVDINGKGADSRALPQKGSASTAEIWSTTLTVEESTSSIPSIILVDTRSPPPIFSYAGRTSSSCAMRTSVPAVPSLLAAPMAFIFPAIHSVRTSRQAAPQASLDYARHIRLAAPQASSHDAPTSTTGGSTGTATRFHIAATTLYLMVNVLFVTIPKATWADMGTRAATMSVINLIPLLCGPRLSMVTKLLGISLRTSLASHKWIGRTAMGLAGLHIVIIAKDGERFARTWSSISGVVASSALGLIFILSIRPVIRRVYEWFLNSHLLLAAIALLAIWRHLPTKTAAAKFLNIGIYRGGSGLASTSSFQYPDLEYLAYPTLLQVDITVPRPWRVRASQHVFLSIPGLGIFTGLRGHPFVIAWWDRDGSGLSISILVTSKNGFTRELRRNANKTFRAFIDGPFGIPHDFGAYGTVIMIATGIGHEDAVRPWIVKPWMDKILTQDTGMVSLHVPESGKQDEELGTHSKIKVTSTPPDIEGLLRKEIAGGRRGDIIVSLCADNAIADRARTQVQTHMDKGVRLVELDFQPSSFRTAAKDTRGMEFSCRG
ncbi:hypothetical protein V490_00407 [Pseudogymnoascus sp. VKM F-3557]|nr:hypothetical protein V490_00407 [Pseudogymnoascus sp. VKM F-3557]